ncbi:NAD(P)-dependent oxidoreductase [Candidatus Uhrbacteria bacterium]|nr:NAD(P)-dependent oxidoreductase [Candidatus Uhrbacteria bacterium]
MESATASKGKKILVTGSNGLLGSTLVRVLEEKGHKILEFQGDIADAANVQKHAEDIGPEDWIIHTAALTDVNMCEKDRDLCHGVNVEGTRNVVDLARSCVAKLIYISTVSVFSGEEGDYKEGDLPYPKNYYNLSKYLGEIAVSAYPKSTILRINLIGLHPDGSRGQNFLEWLYDSIEQNKDTNLFTDVRINPLSNWTLAEIITRIMDTDVKERVLHLGSRDVLSKAEVAQFLLTRLPGYSGKATLMSVDEVSKAAFRPKEIWLNVEKAQNVLGMEFPTLEQEIEKIFNSKPIK